MDANCDRVAALGEGQHGDAILVRALGIRPKQLEVFGHA